MRKFGVEEELLLVDAATLRPSPLGEQAVVLHHGIASSGSGLATELKQEQIESVCPPQPMPLRRLPADARSPWLHLQWLLPRISPARRGSR